MMHYDYLNLETLGKALLKNKPELYDDSVQLFDDCLGGYFEIMLLLLNPDYKRISVLDREKCIQTMKEVLLHPKSGTLGKRFDDWDVFFQNEVVFFNNLLSSKLDYLISGEDRTAMHAEYNKVLSSCLKKYYAESEHVRLLERLPKGDFYKQVIVEKAKVANYLVQGSPFNKDQIVLYYERLIASIYHDFSLDTQNSTKLCKRYVKTLTKDIVIGFELDFTNSMKSMKRGEFYLPTYLNLFIGKVDKAAKLTKDSLLYLGVYANPFFHRVSFSIRDFFSNTYRVDYDDVENKPVHQFFYQVMQKEVDQAHTELIFPEKQMDWVKRYSLYYYALLHYSSHPYLKYIEKSVLEALV